MKRLITDIDKLRSKYERQVKQDPKFQKEKRWVPYFWDLVNDKNNNYFEKVKDNIE